MLIIVKSPLQIICAVEYIHSLNVKISGVKFIYLRKYSLADLQMNNTFRFYGIVNFRVIKFGNSNYIKVFGISIVTSKVLPLKVFSIAGKTFTDFFAKRRLFSFVRNMTDNTLVLGDPNYKLYRELVSLISRKKIILLDDGLGSIETHYNYSAKNEVISFSFLRTQAKNCTQSIINSFSKTKSLYSGTPDKSFVLFIGQPLYEANLMSIGEMQILFRKIGELYASRRIIYIAHRWEQNIKLFQFPANFELISNQDLPLELFISQINPLPIQVVSFYSSALITLKKILPDKVVFSAFDIQSAIAIPGIGDAYNKIRSHGIDVVKFQL